jgi:hypothetical protein
MRHDKDDSSRALDSLADIGNSNDILRKLDSREILLVLVILINDLCQLSSLKLDVSPDSRGMQQGVNVPPPRIPRSLLPPRRGLCVSWHYDLRSLR